MELANQDFLPAKCFINLSLMLMSLRTISDEHTKKTEDKLLKQSSAAQENVREL